MATRSLTDYARIIKEQIFFQEELSDQFAQMEAMASLITIEDFLNFEQHIIQNYFWVLRNLIDAAKKLNEQNLKALYNGSNSRVGESDLMFGDKIA